jgi:hypothetical protein
MIKVNEPIGVPPVSRTLKLLAGMTIVLPALAHAGTLGIYWQDEGSQSIQRANADGTHVQTIVNVGFGGTGLAVDPVGEKVYWTTNTGGTEIARANLDERS